MNKFKLLKFKISLFFQIKKKKFLDFCCFFKILTKESFYQNSNIYKVFFFSLKIGIFKFFIILFVRYCLFTKKNFINPKIQKFYCKNHKSMKKKLFDYEKYLIIRIKNKIQYLNHFYLKLCKTKKKKIYKIFFFFFLKSNSHFFFKKIMFYNKYFLKLNFKKKNLKKNLFPETLDFKKKKKFKNGYFKNFFRKTEALKSFYLFKIIDFFKDIIINHFDINVIKCNKIFLKNSIKSLNFFLDYKKFFQVKKFVCKLFQINNMFSILFFLKRDFEFFYKNQKKIKYFLREKKLEYIKNKTNIQINGTNFFKLKFIGKGGSGKIYKIINLDGEIFALKKSRINNSKIENLHNRINEISICKIFKDQIKIIQLKDADISIENGIVYMIFEYGECDLEYLIENNSQKSVKKIFLKIFWKQILDAVHIIHKERIVHGDIKPSNFLLVNKCIKIIDFGVSKFIFKNNNNIVRFSQIGTLNYMSQEAILEIPYKKKKIFKISCTTDIWSLGCIFFQMLYAKPPFYFLPLGKKIQAIISKAFRIIFLPLNIDYVADMVKICLERNPEIRPSIFELKNNYFFLEKLPNFFIKKNVHEEI